MKRSVLTLMALGAVLATAAFALGQASKSGAGAPAAPAAKATKLVKIATITGAQANREFQANVQLLQAQRQAAIELTAALEKEKDTKKKQDLKTQLDSITAKLNENNATMVKNYGFSLTRNYTIEIETANIYMQVTDEEAAKFDQVQKENEKAAAAKKK